MKLLTFEPRLDYKDEYILRLEHIYDVGEHHTFSSPVEVSLMVYLFYYKLATQRSINNMKHSHFLIKELFKGFNIEEIRETTLDGNVMESDLKRLSWKSTNKNIDANFLYHASSLTLDRIKLKPMEIRTFVIKLTANK